MELALGHTCCRPRARAVASHDRPATAASCRWPRPTRLLLLVLAVAAPRFFRPSSSRDLRGQQRPGAGRGRRHDAGHPRPADRHLGRLAVRICGVVAGLLARAGLPMPLVGARHARRRAPASGRSTALLVARPRPAVDRRHAGHAGRSSASRCAVPARASSSATCPPASSGSGSARTSAGMAGRRDRAAAAVRGLRLGARLDLAGRPRGLRHRLRRRGRAARRHPARRVVFGVFVVMGALAGLAALLNAVRFADVDPNAGHRPGAQVIAAVVVGGTAVSGGRGTLIGTLLGVALLGSIGPALVFLGTPAAVGEGDPGRDHPAGRRVRRLLARARPRGTPCLTPATAPARRDRRPWRAAACSRPQMVLVGAARRRAAVFSPSAPTS